MNDVEFLRNLISEFKEKYDKDKEDIKIDNWNLLHSLKEIRPLVHIRMYMCFKEEIWPLECIDSDYREVELAIKHKLYHLKMGDDTVVDENVVLRAIYGCDKEKIWGVETSLGEPSSGGYREYKPSIIDIDDVDKLIKPIHIIDEGASQRKLDKVKEAVGDLLPIYLSKAPILKDMEGSIAKDLARMLGMEEIMWYVYDRPEWLHGILEKMRDGILQNQKTAEDLNHIHAYDSFNQSVPYSNELIEPYKDEVVKRDRLWGFFAAQEYTLMSPNMHDEFMLQYQIPIMQNYGLVSYGCCEDLTNKIDMLRQVKNLRRIAVSPQANLEKCARQIQSDYVISWRPNPALMVCNGYDEDFVEKFMIENMKILKENNCIYEISLKDIATVQNKPNRLIEWNNVVKRAIFKVYG